MSVSKRSRGKMRGKGHFHITLEGMSPRLERILEEYPEALAREVKRNGARGAGAPVKAAMEILAPDSKKPRPGWPQGTRKGWTSKTRAARAGKKQLKSSIGVKVVSSKLVGGMPTVIVGPKRPDGNIANLVGRSLNPKAKNTRRQILWGTPSGKRVAKDDRFVYDALWYSKRTAARAYVKACVKAIRRIRAKVN